MVYQRAPLYRGAFGGALRPTRARGEPGAQDAQPGHGRRTERDPHPVHFVLIRIVARRGEPPPPHAPGEDPHPDPPPLPPRAAPGPGPPPPGGGGGPPRPRPPAPPPRPPAQ